MAVNKMPNNKRMKTGLILGGCLLLAILGLFLLSTPTAHESTGEVNQAELRQSLQPAADAYMLAETAEERQAAARTIRSTKEGSRSVHPNTTLEMYTMLRGILWLTIVLLSWNIITLAFPVLKPRKAKMV